jgi:hypothetical protein
MESEFGWQQKRSRVKVSDRADGGHCAIGVLSIAFQVWLFKVQGFVAKRWGGPAVASRVPVFCTKRQIFTLGSHSTRHFGSAFEII